MGMGDWPFERLRCEGFGKKYLKDLYNVDTQEQVVVHMCGYDGFRRGNCFGGEPIRKIGVEERVKKLKNGKAAGKDEVTEEMVKGGGDVVVDWIWKLCNLAFESDVVPEDLSSTVIVPLHKGKGEMIKCKNYGGINLLSVVGKIYADILADRVRSVTRI